MTLKALARWATLIATLAAPLAASADKDYDKDKDKTSDEAQKDKDKPSNAKLSDAELSVVAHVHQVNLMEIDMGRLAQRKGTTAAIKDYGKMLITDHQKSEIDLASLAKRRGQHIPKSSAMNDTDKQDMKDNDAAIKHLKSLKGSDFDRELLTMSAQGHDKELARVDISISQVNDSELKSMLVDMKPVLQRHADQARDLVKGNAQASAEHDEPMKTP